MCSCYQQWCWLRLCVCIMIGPIVSERPVVRRRDPWVMPCSSSVFEHPLVLVIWSSFVSEASEVSARVFILCALMSFAARVSSLLSVVGPC